MTNRRNSAKSALISSLCGLLLFSSCSLPLADQKKATSLGDTTKEVEVSIPYEQIKKDVHTKLTQKINGTKYPQTTLGYNSQNVFHRNLPNYKQFSIRGNDRKANLNTGISMQLNKNMTVELLQTTGIPLSNGKYNYVSKLQFMYDVTPHFSIIGQKRMNNFDTQHTGNTYLIGFKSHWKY